MTLTYGFRNNPTTVEYLTSLVGPGWKNILVGLVADLEQLGWDGKVLQVKEKWGGLRFYIDTGSDEVFNRIVQAEAESVLVCEQCGQPGKRRKGGWILTLCDTCHQKRQNPQ